MDLRIPSGWFFLLLGALLIITGVVAAPTAPLTDVNINIYAGAAMAIFGGVMLWLSRKQPS
jgi:hypothetical protein